MKEQTMREKALGELKLIWDTCRKQNIPRVGYDSNEWSNLSNDERSEILSTLKYMENYGWIELQQGFQCRPKFISLTNAGIDIVEKVSSLEQNQNIQNNFNVTNNSGVLAVNAKNIIINNGLKFDDIEELINSRIQDSKERQEILSEIHELRSKIESGKPLEKGVLSTLGTKLQKYSWLTSPLVDNIAQYLFSLDPSITLKNLISALPSKQNDV